MPIQETITIINNSGKIISTGKQLVNIFKEAKAAYREKKDALRAQRAPIQGMRRAQTFDVVTPRRAGPAVEYYEYGADDYYEDHVYDRRRSHDDGHSLTSSRRSDRSQRSHRHRSASQSRPALTASNLRTHSEVSASSPSAPPQAYRSPYAESARRDMALSRPSLHHAATTSAIHPHLSRAAAPPSALTETFSPVPTLRHSTLVHRPRSDLSLPRKKPIDMNLAYGNIPPDLASRVDLDPDIDPAYYSSDDDLPPPLPTRSTFPLSRGIPHPSESQAYTLLTRIESLLDEASCLHHTAASIILHLQSSPEAAAAVALTLAELSSLLQKLSPSFLPVLKSLSPTVFALLASPQFLIAAGVTVGVTVVMFGGWKIVKRIRDGGREREGKGKMAFEAEQGLGGGGMYGGGREGEGQGREGAVFDEALVLEEELSTIESWRRGIVPLAEDETADMELISPEASRRLRGDDISPDDSASRSGRSHRSRRTHRSSRGKEAIPERRSSKGFKNKEGGDDGESRSERSGKSGSHKSSRSRRADKVGIKAIEGRKEEGNTLDAVLQKDKKPNMLKTLFKKKKERADGEKAEVSVLV